MLTDRTTLISSYFSTTIKERLTQGGASGAFFFFSKGEKFIAKSCTAEEIESLTGSAARYSEYLTQHKDSFISKVAARHSHLAARDCVH